MRGRLSRGRLSPALALSIAAMAVAIGGTALMARAGGGGPDTGKIVGYAYVKDDGDVRSKLSLNVTNANVRLAPGSVQFCFKKLPFTFKGAQVTIDLDHASNLASTAQFTRSVYGNCSDDEPASVWTQNPSSFEPEPFYIVFYK